jgi:predicted secreted protein
MPSTGINDGALVKIMIGTDTISHLVNATISLTAGERDITTKDSGGYVERAYGLKSATVTAEGLYAEDATYGFTDLYASWTAGSDVTVLYNSNVSGDKNYSFSAIITDLGRTSGNSGENETFTVTFQSNGTISENTET